jgi:hypothetical protein
MVDRLVEKVAEGGVQRAGQDERRPEKEDARHAVE